MFYSLVGIKTQQDTKKNPPISQTSNRPNNQQQKQPNKPTNKLYKKVIKLIFCKLKVIIVLNGLTMRDKWKQEIYTQQHTTAHKYTDIYNYFIL